jgi:hypothetical protein
MILCVFDGAHERLRTSDCALFLSWRPLGARLNARARQSFARRDDWTMGVARVDRGAADDDDDDDGRAARVVAAEEVHARAVAAAFVRQMRVAPAQPSGGRSDAVASASTMTTSATAMTTTMMTMTASTSRPEDVKATAEARRDAARRGDERDYERRRNADLTRKLERACVNNRKLEMEVHKLKSLLHAGAGAGRGRRRARGATATPAETFADGTPAMVSFEYHTSVMEAFDRKVESLVMEIERLRASGMRDDGERRALAREIEPEPAPPARVDDDDARTPVRRAPRRDEEREDGDDDDDDHAPFSPTMSPLDALLNKIASSSSLGRADRRGDDGRRRHRTILGDTDRNRGDVGA